MRKLLTIGFLLVLPVLAQAQEPDAAPAVALPEAEVTRVMTAAVNGFIRPGYDAFQTSAEKMTKAMAALCQAPSSANLGSAKSAFRDVATAWARVEIIRIGPVIEQNRFERILFYPDRKSTGLKQVQAALSKEDQAATDPAALGTRSVAMQGLGALEYVLYGTGSEDLAKTTQNYRCRYGAAIAANVANVAKDISGIWDAPDGIAATWEKPGPDNPAFRTGGEAITALLGILVHGTEAVRDQRIETFYKGSDKAKFPRQALFWRSQNTWPSVEGNLASLSDLLEGSGMAALLPEKDRGIVAQTVKQLQSTIALTGTINPDLEKAVDDKAEQKKLDAMLSNTKEIIAKLNDGYGGAIGLTSGFSFADGD
jgi:predicted lipoprotein